MALILPQLTTPQEYYPEITYTKFYPHQATDVKIRQNLIFALK
jgi:hypothetical protein